jgi:hypothetical protein
MRKIKIHSPGRKSAQAGREISPMDNHAATKNYFEEIVLLRASMRKTPNGFHLRRIRPRHNAGKEVY